MSEIIVIDKIRMTHDGPVNETGLPIHLQQGSLDGACGPYSLFMALTICGLVQEHEDLTNLKPIRKNSATGKALFKMQELSAGDAGLLFRHGTELEHLKQIAESHGYVTTASIEARKIRSNSNEFKQTQKRIDTKNVKEFVVETIHSNDPVILWLDYTGGAHWSVVIGVEYSSAKDREKKKPSRFLLLDPDAPSSRVSAWNGTVEISSRKDTHVWGSSLGNLHVRFDRALAISSKKI